MKKQMQKIIAIVGPTATGKSDLAVQIAKKINGGIISADSRQVYKWLDIGAGKITKAEMRGVSHYLLDIADPRKERYTAADFASAAKSAANTIFSHRKIPIICGGTGFYIEAFLYDRQFPDVPPNQKLRKILDKKSPETLFKMLKKLDPIRAKNIDPQNKLRVVRAIEIASKLGKVPSFENQNAKSKMQNLIIGLTLSPEILKEKIHSRLVKRMKNNALINEVKKLRKKGVSWKRLHAFGLEYRYVALYLQKKITRDEMLETLEKEIYQYSRRQMAWFRRDKNIQWFSPVQKPKILATVQKFLKK